MSTLVAPSVLTVQANEIPQVCAKLQNCGADWIHCDVMDGVFVPNKSQIDVETVSKIKQNVTIPLDVHLMVSQPHRHVLHYVNAGASIITMHVEALENYSDFERNYTLDFVRRSGALVGLAIKPNTPVELLTKYDGKFDMVLVMCVEPGKGGQQLILGTLQKIAEVRQMFPQTMIQVDGGINADNVSLVLDAGADVVVSGSAIISSVDWAQTINKLR